MQIDHVFSGGLHQVEANAHHEEQVNRLLEPARQRNKPKSCRQVKGPASLSDTGYLTVKDAKQHINRCVEEENHQSQGRKWSRVGSGGIKRLRKRISHQPLHLL